MQATDKENTKICQGGGKTEKATLPEIVSIPQIPDNASITSITFRNKYKGWKSYRMEIKIKKNRNI